MYCSKFLRSSQVHWSLNCKLIFKHLLEFKKNIFCVDLLVFLLLKRGGITIKTRITLMVYVPIIPKNLRTTLISTCVLHTMAYGNNDAKHFT